MKSPVHPIDPHRLFDSRPTFSHVASVLGPARVVLTAGQVGVDADNGVPADLTAQIELAFANLGRCLEAAGATVPDIVKLVYYVVDYDAEHKTYLPVLQRFLGGHRPATTLVPVPALARPALKFEVEAYVAVPQQPPQTVDVVVVGAGLSGLQAAYDLQRRQPGLRVAVVEARDRVGGKTWSVDDAQGAGKFVDRGAAWINDSNQAEVFRLATALGLTLVPQNTTGNVVQEDVDTAVSQFAYGGVPEALAAGGTADMVAIRDKAEAACQAIDLHDPVGSAGHLDALSLEQWVREEGGGTTALAAVAVWTQAMLGLEPGEVSALFFLHYCKCGGGLMQMRSDRKNGGQYLRFERGTQSLSLGLRDLLKKDTILLNSPVRRITQSASGDVHVVSARGEFHCQRVIVSVPTPLYKEIVFDPPLPPAKAALAAGTRLGFINKVILRYPSPWWRAHGLCGLLQSFAGPVAVARDTSVDHTGQFSLTCFLAGRFGRAAAGMTPPDRAAMVAAHVRRTVGKDIADADAPAPCGFEEYEWAKDQWAQGCPCPASPPGLMTATDHALRTPHGKVHFVGTETAYEWKGYMDGALRSGLRGAAEVVKALGTPKL